MAFETKALHFISKAIKGDYNLNDFSYNDKAGFFKTSVEQKESKFQDVKFQEKLPRKNGIVNPPSLMRDPRHPSPKVCMPIFPFMYVALFSLAKICFGHITIVWINFVWFRIIMLSIYNFGFKILNVKHDQFFFNL